MHVIRDVESEGQALLVQLLYLNHESAIISLREFKILKRIGAEKELLIAIGLNKFVRRFEETVKRTLVSMIS